MNKAIFGLITAMIMIVSSTMALAKAECPPGVGDVDCECFEHGYDFGIAKFECGKSYDIDTTVKGYDLTVEGDCQSADWTSDPDVDGVLVKAGTLYEVYSGGSSGTVASIKEVKKHNTVYHDISHLTFCGKGSNGGGDGGDDDNEVPVFPGITIGFAVVGAGLGITMLRKQE